MTFAKAARLAALLSAALLPVALAGCGQGQQQAAASAPDRHRRQSGAAHRGRLRRICRPLRCRRFGRDPLPAVRLSLRNPFPGRPDGQAGRSPVHHRPPAVRDRARADARQSRPGARQSLFRRGRSRSRPGLAGEQDHHRAGLTINGSKPRPWPKPPSPRRRRWCIRPNSTSTNTASCVRPSTAASATAASRSAIS